MHRLCRHGCASEHRSRAADLFNERAMAMNSRAKLQAATNVIVARARIARETTKHTQLYKHAHAKRAAIQVRKLHKLTKLNCNVSKATVRETVICLHRRQVGSHHASLLCVAILMAYSRRLDPRCGGRKANTLAIPENGWLVVLGYVWMHQWTVPVSLDEGMKTLGTCIQVSKTPRRINGVRR
jgi:peptidyl-tRNA hydrolase